MCYGRSPTFSPHGCFEDPLDTKVACVPTPLTDHLSNQKGTIQEAMKFLEEAAEIAKAVEHTDYWEYELDDLDDDSLRGFLMDKYFQAVPDGIAKRRAQADEVKRDIEEDERDMRLARLGYTFTFDRQHFWNEVNGMPSDLHKSSIRFGLSCAPRCLATFATPGR